MAVSNWELSYVTGNCLNQGYTYFGAAHDHIALYEEL